ncbi:hypothetical protein C8Q80DRAFT_1193535 [Daedaleopsis nitida]|nr:hypothetical protein C8Q80DRAFT_1193535 [Daedaleopsis nitida]
MPPYNASREKPDIARPTHAACPSRVPAEREHSEQGQLGMASGMTPQGELGRCTVYQRETSDGRDCYPEVLAACTDLCLRRHTAM